MKTLMTMIGLPAILLLTACGGSGDNGNGGGGNDGGNNGTGDGGGNGGGDGGASGPANTAAGSPMGPAVTTSIDAVGGSLSSSDSRIKITVPAGAVSAATTFSIQPITSLAPGAIGVSYDLLPHGVTFAQPITLTFTVPEAGVSRTSVEGLGIALRNDDGTWSWLPGGQRDGTAKTLSATTTHFCNASVLEGIQIRPLVATVALSATQALEIVYCAQENTVDDQLAGLVYNCDSGLVPLVKMRDWSVNGVTGGNSTYGKIAPNGSGAMTGTFTAPDQKPTPQVVLAGAWVGAKGKRGDTFVASNLSIGEPGTFHGRVTIVSGGIWEYTASGELTVTPAKLENGQYDDGIDMTRYDVNGEIEMKPNTVVLYGEMSCTADEPAQTLVHNSINVKKDPVGMFWSLGVEWAITCDVGGQTVQSLVELTWLTGCSPAALDDDYVPLADPNRLRGTDFRSQTSCNYAVGDVLVDWDFQH